MGASSPDKAEELRELIREANGKQKDLQAEIKRLKETIREARSLGTELVGEVTAAVMANTQKLCDDTRIAVVDAGRNLCEHLADQIYDAANKSLTQATELAKLAAPKAVPKAPAPVPPERRLDRVLSDGDLALAETFFSGGLPDMVVLACRPIGARLADDSPMRKAFPNLPWDQALHVKRQCPVCKRHIWVPRKVLQHIEKPSFSAPFSALCFACAATAGTNEVYKRTGRKVAVVVSNGHDVAQYPGASDAG